MLGQAGEFGFLVIGLSVSLALIAPGLAQFMLIVVGITMLASPGLDWLARHAAHWLEPAEGLTEDEHDMVDDAIEGHVIIAGYGRVGETIGSVLDRQDIRYLAIESDVGLARAAQADGRPVRLGDAAQLEVLRESGLERAAAVVVTLADEDATEALAGEIHRLAPGLPIFARARDVRHAERLLDMGASFAVPETIEGSLRLAEVLLRDFGTDDAVIQRRIALERAVEEA
jgi:CPA2 family monovalent cation:H+ antiporter-2